MADRVTAGDRVDVAERARDRCEYCLSPARFATQTFAVEHIIPVSRGGDSSLSNLALACPGCNGHKYNKREASDPVTGQLVALFHPRRQRWQDHFKWNDDFTRILGVTATGRATVSALQMNRQGVVNLRGALFAVGRHPPAEA